MKFPTIRPSWLVFLSGISPRGRGFNPSGLIPSALERRELLSALPMVAGQVAPFSTKLEDLATAKLGDSGASPVSSVFSKAEAPLAGALRNHLFDQPALSFLDDPFSPRSMPTINLANPVIARFSAVGNALSSMLGGPGPLAPLRSSGGHKDLSEANALVDGVPTPELAVLDEEGGTVNVFEGSRVVFGVGGLDHPEGVKLADLNHDGSPDLIIADSGANKVFVYPGQSQGRFGPEVTGGVGFSVGLDPVGLTVGDLNGDGQADLVVANKGSNNVTVLLGHGSGAGWGLTLGATIHAGIAPVRSLIVTPDQGSNTPDILICNSGSNDVYAYQTTASGQVEARPWKIIRVGATPADLFVGRYSLRQEMDLVTVNSGSDDLTFIGGVFSPHPTRQAVASGGSQPVSAIPLNTSIPGVSDLMVANSDGRIALLQAVDNGLQLTGLAAPLGLGNITSIAAGEQTSTGLSLYEASSNADSIAILRFNPAEVAFFGNAPSANIPLPTNVGESALNVEMVPSGGGMLDLVGVLWSGSTRSGSSEDPPPTPSQAGSKVVGQSLTGPTDTLDPDLASILASSSETDRADVESAQPSTSWFRFVLGLDAAFDSFEGETGAVSSADSSPSGRWISVVPGGRRLVLDQRNVSPNASRFERLDYSVESSPRPSSTEEQNGPKARRAFRSVPNFEGNTSSNEPTELVTAALGSSLAVRLLINASPPRRPLPTPRSRSWTRGRNEAFAPWPEIFPPTSPHA